MISKLFRLVDEFFFVLAQCANPGAYFKARFGERFGEVPGEDSLIRLKNGVSYAIRKGTNQIRLINEIWRLGVYDTFIDRIHENSVVIDIGANIGMFSVKAAHHAADVRVFSFEPERHNFEMLKKNIALNNLSNFVMPFHVAVAGHPGTLDFFYSQKDSGGGSLRKYDDAMDKKISVPAVTLSHIFSANNIETCDFLKIDCEGAEWEILKNAPQELFEKIKTISLEWHEGWTGVPRKTLVDFLEAVGYEVSFEPKFNTMYAKRKS